MKKLVFRFDIDTHKCIRDGVPRLLDIAEQYHIGFTFFLNVGRAISLRDSIGSLMEGKRAVVSEQIQMMSALEKLGGIDYVQAALFNPQLICYTKQVGRLLKSDCEVGIHGGKNHALWHKYAADWGIDKLEYEIKWALMKLKKQGGMNFLPKGFASPGWTSPPALEEVLSKCGFKYCADYKCKNEERVIKKGKFLNYVGVNLLGEPGGVAFFENCRVKGYSTDRILEMVFEYINQHDITVVYDHPYYAGIRETECIRQIIESVQKMEGIEICTLEELV